MDAPATGGDPSSVDPLASPRRLASLAATRLLDTKSEEAFDRLTRLASNVLGVPVAAVTLLDATRQFIKSGVGLDLESEAARSSPVEDSFCQHAVRSRAPFVVTDALTNDLVKDSRFAASMRAYAGIPITNGGEPLGAFCVADAKPRQWTERELAILRDLSAAVESQIAAHVVALEAQQRRELLETVLDTMGSGLLVCDADGEMRITNAEARRLHGDVRYGGPLEERARRLGLYTADGKTLFAPDELPLLRAARGERIDDLDAVLRPPGMPGHVTFVSVTARPLPNGGAVMIIHDRTAEHELERRARINEALYHKLANNIPNALVYLLDRDLKILLAQGSLLAKVDTQPESVVGRSLLDYVFPENGPQTKAALTGALAGKSGNWTATRGGHAYEAHVEPVYEGGEISGAIVMYFEVTERMREADERRKVTARLEALLEHMSDGVIFEDADYHVRVVNRAALDLFGVTKPSELIGVDLTAPASISAPAARNSFAQPALASLEIERRRERGERIIGERIELADGRIIERDFLPVVGADGVHQGNLWMHRDVTERVRSQIKIEEASVRDELTGLLNRRGFMQQGHRAVTEAVRAGSPLVLFFIDLNGMKPINDQLGHEEGDRALVDTARCLERVFGPQNVIGRLGGDEFVALVASRAESPPTRFERALRDAVTAFNDSCKRLYRLSLSIGATELDPRAPRTIDQLLSAADAQMYSAKRARQARGGVSLPPPTSKA
ncbi:MAG: diguanylate cyclase [Labilithrix sp.]